MAIIRPRIIALDLEGTLISNAISQIPRPGTKEFFAFCFDNFDRICIFSAVSAVRIRAILTQLVCDGILSQECCDAIEIIDWQGPHKDLSAIPGSDWREILIVDDLATYILPQQQTQWIQVSEFAPPYPRTDKELTRIVDLIKTRLDTAF